MKASRRLSAVRSSHPSLAASTLVASLVAMGIGACGSSADAGADRVREASTTFAAHSGANDPTRVAPDAVTTPAYGAANPVALVTIFVDYQCPACRRVPAIIDRVVTGYGQDAQVHIRHFPLTGIHPHAMAAAIAVQAAHRQGASLCLGRQLYERQAQWGRGARSQLDGVIAAAAEHCRLDPTRLAHDRADPAVAAKVQTDVAAAEALGVRGTPTVLVNGVQADLVPLPGRTTDRLLSGLIRREILLSREALDPGEARRDFLAERIYSNVGDELSGAAGAAAEAERDAVQRYERAEAAPALLME